MKTNIRTLNKWHKLWLAEPDKVRFRYKQNGEYTNWDFIAHWNLHDKFAEQWKFEFKLV